MDKSISIDERLTNISLNVLLGCVNNTMVCANGFNDLFTGDLDLLYLNVG